MTEGLNEDRSHVTLGHVWVDLVESRSKPARKAVSIPDPWWRSLVCPGCGVGYEFRLLLLEDCSMGYLAPLMLRAIDDTRMASAVSSAAASLHIQRRSRRLVYGSRRRRAGCKAAAH